MKNVFAQRLKAARIRARLSLDELANAMRNVVTKQALGQYEKGKMLPGSSILIALADALNQTPDYFFAPIEMEIELMDVAFRKLTSKVGKKEEESIKQQTVDSLEKYLELLERTAQSLKQDEFIYSKTIKTVEDAEKAAKELREEWSLGYDPIPSVVDMLEDKGYIVFVIEANEAFSGMKATFREHKVIVINKGSVDRMRFTALHELAHHVLRFDKNLSHKMEEKLCHAFSGAVLYPEEMARKEMDGQRFHFYQKEMELIKSRWGISIAALFGRALNLGIINDYVYARLNIGYKQKGLHKGEPEVWRGIEQPQQFDRLLYKALAEDLISINDAAYLKDMAVPDFRETLIPLA